MFDQNERCTSSHNLNFDKIDQVLSMSIIIDTSISKINLTIIIFVWYLEVCAIPSSHKTVILLVFWSPPKLSSTASLTLTSGSVSFNAAFALLSSIFCQTHNAQAKLLLPGILHSKREKFYTTRIKCKTGIIKRGGTIFMVSKMWLTNAKINSSSEFKWIKIWMPETLSSLNVFSQILFYLFIYHCILYTLLEYNLG